MKNFENENVNERKKDSEFRNKDPPTGSLEKLGGDSLSDWPQQRHSEKHSEATVPQPQLKQC